ncbi:glycosyltransferase family 4 protein [Macrococcoides bohemicum]|uniref:glycosyltransferase family 4 protein n=1 Tax=Macrococcoides bohemicum TaxID=1903056 RepID=UPI001C5F826A|nr:glycosyltransferase family 4 protein [Macrococcus bohemicus]QYA44580.1 glycosyltransferase family 4 protein [Macrococcus bohemicus]
MNYLIINHYATTPEYNGGTRHYDMAKELVKLGHQVSIISSSFNHFTKTETKVFENNDVIEEDIDGIHFYWVRTPPYNNSFARISNMISFYLRSSRFFNRNKLLIHPDIVIGSTVHLLAAQLGVKLAKKYNAKFYFEERDFWPQTFVDFGKITKNNPVAKILYKYEEYFYKKADKIIVLFPKADQYIISRGIDKEKIIYLPNGYSNIDKEPLENQEISKIQAAISVTYIGSMGLANNIEDIIDFAHLCRDLPIKFILIGDGSKKVSLLKKVEDLNIDNVFFFDSIRKNQVQTALEHTTFSIISIKDSPLYKYGFSMNKIFDYLNAEKPIIMITSKELAHEFETEGIIINSNLIELKKELVNYLNDVNLYHKDIKNLRNFKEKYNWSIQVEKLIEK